jgi:hypothetical protein
VGRLHDDDAARCTDLLDRLRALDGLSERAVGVFYRGAKPFLHFHGRGDDLVSDLKAGSGWLRYPVATAADRRVVVADARRVLGGNTTGLRGSST